MLIYLDGCEDCGGRDGSHSRRCWRDQLGRAALQECPPAPKLPPDQYDEPPF